MTPQRLTRIRAALTRSTAFYTLSGRRNANRRNVTLALSKLTSETTDQDRENKTGSFRYAERSASENDGPNQPDRDYHEPLVRSGTTSSLPPLASASLSAGPRHIDGTPKRKA